MWRLLFERDNSRTFSWRAVSGVSPALVARSRSTSSRSEASLGMRRPVPTPPEWSLSLPEPTNPKPIAPATLALPSVTGAVVRFALERHGWSVRGEDSAHWAMRKGGSFPLMVPKQDWPIAQTWLRDILKDSGITDAEFIASIIIPPT